MKWFDMIQNDNAVAKPLITDGHNFFGIDEVQLSSGTRVKHWQEKSWLMCTDSKCNGDPDDALQNHLALPVFSQRLRRAIRRSGIGDIQYLPVRVLRPNREEVPGFSIANILAKVPALDTSRSDLEVFEDGYFIPERRGKVSSLRRAVLKGRGLRSHHIVRLAEFEVAMFCSERFKDVFEREGCTGFSFEQVRVS